VPDHVHPDLPEVRRRPPKSDGPGDRRRSRLVALFAGGERVAVGGYPLDRTAPDEEGLEVWLAHPEPPRPGRPEHLVPGETEVVAPHTGGVDREVRHRLGRVDKELCAPVVTDAGDLPDREDGAEDV